MTTFDRRSFIKASMLAVAASSLPLRAEPQQPVRFAAVGLGSISDIFMQACAQSSKCKVNALVTGHAAEKAPKYETLYGVSPKAVYDYQNYDEIAHNPDIDAVYIGLPNSMHAEYTIRAARAGKHVLCEKPMAISSAECRQMIDACRQHNVKLMIAYRVHYDPMWQQIRKLVRDGGLGQVQGFQGGFYGVKTAGWRLDRKLAGGGSLLDLGIYPLNTIRWIVGEEPVSFSAQAGTRAADSRFSTVEESIEFSMKFSSGVLASSGSSYGEMGGAYLSIDGADGNLWVEPAFFYEGLKFHGETLHGAVSQASPAKRPYQFVYEADHFANCIRSNREPDTSGEEGLKDLLAIEGIYRAAGAPIA
jgi:predicted dehydrogenase